MTLALIALVILAIVIFGFVLEPILRARGDQAVLDAAALPDSDATPLDDEPEPEPVDHDAPPRATDDERIAATRLSVDRPAGSDVS